MSAQPRLICIDDAAPKETTDLLAEACVRRDVQFERLWAPGFDFDPSAGLERGDMVYRPAVSTAALRVEQCLWREGLATFHRDPLGPFFCADAYPLLFQHLGLPVPRTLPVRSRDRDRLKAAVQALGGLPVIVKLMGFEGGVGVMRLDSWTTLVSMIDYLVASGREPLLAAYVDQAVHWRVIVLGGEAVAAYRNTPEPDDFRTYASEDPADFTTEPDADLVRLAVAAANALRVDFAGVDLLRHPSGRIYLLEANFPCWFAQSQIVAGIDVAGAMVDRLLDLRRGMLGDKVSD